MKIHHIAITVNNIDESIQFYTDNFGFVVDFVVERPEKGRKFAMLQGEDCRLELREFVAMKDAIDDLGDITIRGIRHIAFEVDTIVEEVKRLEGKGLSFSDIKESSIGGYYTFTTDPNGVALELYELPKK